MPHLRCLRSLAVLILRQRFLLWVRVGWRYTSRRREVSWPLNPLWILGYLFRSRVTIDSCKPQRGLEVARAGNPSPIRPNPF
jgi:hypothetical protein